MSARVFEPIPIAYRGLYADDHLVDAQQFGQSIASAGQIANSICHQFLFENVTHDPRSYQVRFFVGTSKKNGLIQEIIAVMNSGSMPVFAPVLLKTGKIFIERMFDAVIAHTLKKPSDMGKALDTIRDMAAQHHEFATQVHQGQMRDKKWLRALVEHVVSENRAPLRALPSPVGKTVRQMQIGDKSTGPIIDEPAADVLRSHDLLEIGEATKYEVKIVGVFKTNGTCRVRIGQTDCVVPGKIVDPVLDTPHNVYTAALDQDVPILVTAKPTLKDGRVHRLYILDAEIRKAPRRRSKKASA